MEWFTQATHIDIETTVAEGWFAQLLQAGGRWYNSHLPMEMQNKPKLRLRNKKQFSRLFNSTWRKENLTETQVRQGLLISEVVVGVGLLVCICAHTHI